MCASFSLRARSWQRDPATPAAAAPAPTARGRRRCEEVLYSYGGSGANEKVLIGVYGGDRYIGKKKDLTNGKPASPRKRSTWLSATGRGSKAHRLANYHVHGAELAKHGECPRCDDAKALQLPASGSGLAGSKRPAPDSLSALDSEFGTLLSTFHKSQKVLRPARPEDGGVAVSKGLFLVSRWQSWCLSTR